MASRPRRSHKKSKAGCQRCKLRKVKCDEAHPVCGNCSKHGVSCDFEGIPIDMTSPTTSTSTSTSPSPASMRQDSVGGASSVSTLQSSSNSSLLRMYQTPSAMIRPNFTSQSSRLLELKLMHHFTAQTAITFSDLADATIAWQTDIPALAYEAPYLMDAILAVSALHLRSYKPDDQDLVRASHGYMASSISQYSSLLTSGLSASNAEALFSTAALIAFQASASRCFDNPEGTYTVPLAWFHSFQGVKIIVMASWQWLRSSEKVSAIINSQPALSLNLDANRRLFFAPILEGLEDQLETLQPSMVVETRQAYEHAVAFLNWAYQKPHRNRILGFAATVSRRFVDLVSENDPRTLVIIACFFALTKCVDDVWWLKGVAKQEVNGIFSLLPQDWWPKMEWPLRIANHEGPIDDQTWGTPISKIKIEEDVVFGNVFNHIDILTQLIETYAPPMPPD